MYIIYGYCVIILKYRNDNSPLNVDLGVNGLGFEMFIKENDLEQNIGKFKSQIDKLKKDTYKESLNKLFKFWKDVTTNIEMEVDDVKWDDNIYGYLEV